MVFFLVCTILALRQSVAGLTGAIGGLGQIIEKSAPVNGVVADINANLDAGVDLLEGLLVKKAGLGDAIGLVDGLYPGAAAEGLRNVPDSRTTRPPRIGEVYTRGTLTLARLGREAPIAAASPNGLALRNPVSGSLPARRVVSGGSSGQGRGAPPLAVIGADSLVQYDAGEDVGGPRKRMPVSPGQNRS